MLLLLIDCCGSLLISSVGASEEGDPVKLLIVGVTLVSLIDGVIDGGSVVVGCIVGDAVIASASIDILGQSKYSGVKSPLLLLLLD